MAEETSFTIEKDENGKITKRWGIAVQVIVNYITNQLTFAVNWEKEAEEYFMVRIAKRMEEANLKTQWEVMDALNNFIYNNVAVIAQFQIEFENLKKECITKWKVGGEWKEFSKKRTDYSIKE